MHETHSRSEIGAPKGAMMSSTMGKIDKSQYLGDDRIAPCPCTRVFLISG
jgi:hypothetical protein